MLDYSDFQKYCMMIAIYLSNQGVFDADPEAIQQINFIGNLDQPGNATFAIIEEAKEIIFDFSQGTGRVL